MFPPLYPTVFIEASHCPCNRSRTPSARCLAAADCTHWNCPRSEEHTSELQSLMRISYAVFCLKKKKIHIYKRNITTLTKPNRPPMIVLKHLPTIKTQT